ncbi:MAG: hypothetical protein WCG87_10065, partial [Bacteroidota bacterium]
LLTLLTGYLILLIIQQGNTGSCGCFGNWIYMKPLHAIWKNLIMIAATIILIFIYPFKEYKGQEWISVIAAMAALVVPFIIYPIPQNSQPEIANQAIDLSPLYRVDSTKPSVELRTGKHIIAFMSLTCPHCKKAAYLLQSIHHKHPEIPMFFVLSGLPEQEGDFFIATHAQDVPHIRFHGAEDFIRMAGSYVPAIYWVDNSIITRKSNYYQLDPQLMSTWLKTVK